ncbi:aquaporin SIP2-1 [Tripterygium wilfordii]|uniref:Aquaporin SIP2-1 n=1 Tax=Tripterygium wilfordii TaxID=458696 RepID=A0A7J7DVJ5_TRIWF|nr:aquaporin SIP2-1 [Tripterygium wilfordii]
MAKARLTVIGSIAGVRILIDSFPEVGLGPHGALTEGFLTFAIVIISLGLSNIRSLEDFHEDSDIKRVKVGSSDTWV